MIPVFFVGLVVYCSKNSSNKNLGAAWLGVYFRRENKNEASVMTKVLHMVPYFL